MDRLLYVAATRAGNALIISDSSSANSPWEPLLRQDEEDEGLPENEHIPDILRLIVGSGFQPEDSLSPGKETKLPGEAQRKKCSVPQPHNGKDPGGSVRRNRILSAVYSIEKSAGRLSRQKRTLLNSMPI